MIVTRMRLSAFVWTICLLFFSALSSKAATVQTCGDVPLFADNGCPADVAFVTYHFDAPDIMQTRGSDGTWFQTARPIRGGSFTLYFLLDALPGGDFRNLPRASYRGALLGCRYDAFFNSLCNGGFDVDFFPIFETDALGDLINSTWLLIGSDDAGERGPSTTYFTDRYSYWFLTDRVVATSIPLPSSVVLLISGLGMSALFLRRRA